MNSSPSLYSCVYGLHLMYWCCLFVQEYTHERYIPYLRMVTCERDKKKRQTRYQALFAAGTVLRLVDYDFVWQLALSGPGNLDVEWTGFTESLTFFFNLSIISGLLLFDLPLIILSFVYMFSDPINFLLFSLAFPCLPSALTLFYPFLPCHPDTLFLSSWVCQVSTLRD